MRRLVGSVPCALLAALLVLSRLLGPAVAAPTAGAALAAFDQLARTSICHVSSDGAGSPANDTPTGYADCLQCPACHLASTAALPVPPAPVVPPPPATMVGQAALPPPATGPPGRVRGSAQPTGPPALPA